MTAPLQKSPPKPLSHIPESLGGSTMGTVEDDQTLMTRESALSLLSTGQSLWLEQLIDGHSTMLENVMEQSLTYPYCSSSWLFPVTVDKHKDDLNVDDDDDENDALLFHELDGRLPLLEHGRAALWEADEQLSRLQSYASSQGEEWTVEESLQLIKEPQKRLKKPLRPLFGWTSATTTNSPPPAVARKRLSFLRPVGDHTSATNLAALSSPSSRPFHNKPSRNTMASRSPNTAAAEAPTRTDALVVMNPTAPAATTQALVVLKPTKTVAAVPRQRIPQL